MNDIPEEIRKMFPDQPIHKLDIDNNESLHLLASAEPLNDPFENMPIDQVDQYLRDHGYDPAQVGLRGKILSDALIENIKLRARAEAAEKRVAELEAEAKWTPSTDDTDPIKDGQYQVLIDGKYPSHEYYSVEYGWTTDKNITDWRELPQSPQEEK